MFWSCTGIQGLIVVLFWFVLCLCLEEQSCLQLLLHPSIIITYADYTNQYCVCVWSSTKMMIVKGACVFFSLETDEQVRAFAEKVFASETKDEDIREEVSLFGVADCPILNQELEHHLTVDDDIERRWGKTLQHVTTLKHALPGVYSFIKIPYMSKKCCGQLTIRPICVPSTNCCPKVA